MAEDKKGAKQKARRPSAKKRDLQHAKRRARNSAFRARTHTAIRSLKESPEALDTVYSLLDKGVKKGVLKKNQANRLKSRLSKKVAAAKA
jgi:small subunit ribosomal protein S20